MTAGFNLRRALVHHEFARDVTDRVQGMVGPRLAPLACAMLNVARSLASLPSLLHIGSIGSFCESTSARATDVRGCSGAIYCLLVVSHVQNILFGQLLPTSNAS